MESKQFIELLRAAKYEPRSYSGRGMYGRHCVGVDLNRPGDLFRLGIDMSEASVLMGRVLNEVQAPSTGSMGQGIIAYWIWIDWPPGELEYSLWYCDGCGDKNREADHRCESCNMEKQENLTG